MLTRLAAMASGIILCATMAIVLSPAAAQADCKVINDVVYCDASDSDDQPGSGEINNGGSGPSEPNNGCQNQGNGVPGQGCTEGALGQLNVISSAQWAEQARAALPLPTPSIHWTPEPRTYVYPLRTSLWVDPDEFASFDNPVNAGGQTVTAHATPRYVEWDLVEKTIRCPDAGSANGTTCRHAYKRSSASQPNGRYLISATIVWGVTWDCTGDCDPGAGGALEDISMESTALLPVDEIQTESQPG